VFTKFLKLAVTGELISDPSILKPLWILLCTNYLSLAISNPDDRLPALTGIASRLSHPTLGRYLVGCWEKDLIVWLDWVNKRAFAPLKSTEESRPAPVAKTLISSWSWISMSQATMVEFISSSNVLALSQIQNVVITHVSEDAFG
jgi:hypothetical protein